MRSTKTTTPNTSPVPELAKSNKASPVPAPAKSNKAPPAQAKSNKAPPAQAKSNMSPVQAKSNMSPAQAKSNMSPAQAKSNKASPVPAKSNKAPASETPASPEENPGETSKNDVEVVKGRKRKSVRFSDPSGKIEENSVEQNVVAGRRRVQKSANVKQLESDAGEKVPKQTPVKVEKPIVSGKRKRTSTDTAVTPVPIVSPDPENVVPGKRRRQSSSPEVVDSNEIACNKCKETFENVDDLQEHEKSCFKGCKYACHLCTHTNSQKSLLREHIKGKHQGNPFQGSLCPDKTFIYRKSLNKHVKSVHTSKEAKFKYNCPECDFVSDDKTEY